MAKLPVVSAASPIKPSRAARRRAAVLILVHVLIALHIAHWRLQGETVTPVEPSEAMAFAKAGVINAGLIFFAAAILLTAAFGRFFCGWGCHVLALQDLSRWGLERLGIRPRPLGSRWLRVVPAVAFFYMFLWPVVYRLWIGDSFAHFETEWTTSEFWATFPGWVIGGLTFFLCGFVIVYFLGAKGFCAYACPYGAIFAAADRISPMRIRVTDACAGCGHCTAVCTSNVRVHEEVREYGMVVSSDCMKCLDCVSVCPNEALYYGAGPIPRTEKPRRGKAPPWQEEALVLVAFAAAFFTVRGLYGIVPFLMSLGTAAILAALVLFTYRLVRRPNFTLRRIRLKLGGRVQPAGKVYLASMMFLCAFWVHSAYHRYLTFQGARAFQEIHGLQNRALDVSSQPLVLTREERGTVEKALGYLERVRDVGFFHTLGNDRNLTWLYFLLDSEALDIQARLAIEKGEDVAWMYQLLAHRDGNRGRVVEAAENFEHAIAADPNLDQSYIGLGVLWARAGDLGAAGEVMRRGLSQVQDSPQLVYNAGLILALGGDNGKAIEFFERALILDSGYLEARENLAGMLASVGRFEESVAQYRLALEQSPGDAVTHFLLARALLGLGRDEEAQLELRESLRIDPELGEARNLLRRLSR